MEEGLKQDIGILEAHLCRCRLQLSPGKTVSAAYHLNNSEAKWELDLSFDHKRLEFSASPNDLGVRLQ